MSTTTLAKLWAISQTVRFRMTAAITAVVAIALFLIAWIGLVGLERGLLSDLDQSIGAEMEPMIEEWKAGGIYRRIPGFQEDGFAQLVREDGLVVASSGNIAGKLPVADGFLPSGLREGRSIDSLRLSGEDHFRVVGQRFSRANVVYTLYVGESLDTIDQNLGAVRGALIGSVPLLTLMTAAASWYFIGLMLARFENIRLETAYLAITAPNERVSQPAADDEVGRLAGTMNTLLDRVDRAETRQQEFLTNTFEGLRLPLDSIRSRVEHDLQHPHQADPLATDQAVRAEAMRLQAMTNDLLAFARRDTPPALDSATIDLDHALFNEAERLRQRNTVVVNTLRVTGAQLTGDPKLLTRVVRSLMAVAAARANEEVTVGLHREKRANFVELLVEDDGTPLPEEDRERVFDPFFPLDQRGTSAGVELAMVRTIIEWHGGTVDVSEAATHGLRFLVRIPVEDAAEAQPRSAA